MFKSIHHMSNIPVDVTKRMRYFDRQFLRAEDFKTEQDYRLDRQRRVFRFSLTHGIAEGLQISGNVGDTFVMIGSGTAVDDQGNVIVLDKDTKVDLLGQSPVSIFISYHEEPSDPSKDPGIVDYTRIHEKPLFSVVPFGTVPQGGIFLGKVTLDANGKIISTDTSKCIYVGIIIGNNSITEPKLADGSVSTRTIRDANITSQKIAANSITEPNLADNSVSTRTIQNASVTSQKIAANSITEPNLADNSVSNRIIQDNAVIGSKISNGSVSIAKLKATVVNDDFEVSVPPTTVHPQPLIVFIGNAPDHAFYLVSVRLKSGTNSILTWDHACSSVGGNFPQYIRLQNLGTSDVTIIGKVYRIAES